MASLEELESELAELKDAARAVRNGGQSYGRGNRSVTRVEYESIEFDVDLPDSMFTLANLSKPVR